MSSALPHSVENQGETDGAENLVLATPSGGIRSRLHRPVHLDAGIVWVFGAGGGLGGPAGGLYERLGARLQPGGVLSLQVAYRQPGNMRTCVEDALTGVSLIESVGVRRVILIGHSFGGAVVI